MMPVRITSMTNMTLMHSFMLILPDVTMLAVWPGVGMLAVGLACLCVKH